MTRRAEDEQSFGLPVTKFDVGTVCAISRHRGRLQRQLYFRKRPAVAASSSSPNDCKMSETGSSRSGRDRRLSLQSGHPHCRPTPRKQNRRPPFHTCAIERSVSINADSTC